MTALQTSTRTHENATVIALAGDIDIATADSFYDEVVAAMKAPGTGARVVLDCSELTFIDSSGLRVLIQCHKASKELRSQVLIAAPSRRVTQILHVTAIDTRVPVFRTVEDALNG